LLSVKKPHDSYLAGCIHRECNVTTAAFEALKKRFKQRCAHCGSEEGESHLKNRLVNTALQMGHMDPRKPLTLGNCIPLCSMCNGVYRNKFVFNIRGYVKPIGA
jgi:hypothetical protein